MGLFLNWVILLCFSGNFGFGVSLAADTCGYISSCSTCIGDNNCYFVQLRAGGYKCQAKVDFSPPKIRFSYTSIKSCQRMEKSNVSSFGIRSDQIRSVKERIMPSSSPPFLIATRTPWIAKATQIPTPPPEDATTFNPMNELHHTNVAAANIINASIGLSWTNNMETTTQTMVSSSHSYSNPSHYHQPPVVKDANFTTEPSIAKEDSSSAYINSALPTTRLPLMHFSTTYPNRVDSSEATTELPTTMPTPTSPTEILQDRITLRTTSATTTDAITSDTTTITTTTTIVEPIRNQLPVTIPPTSTPIINKIMITSPRVEQGVAFPLPIWFNTSKPRSSSTSFSANAAIDCQGFDKRNHYIQLQLAACRLLNLSTRESLSKYPKYYDFALKNPVLKRGDLSIKLQRMKLQC